MKTSKESRIIAFLLRLIGFKYIITFIAKTKVPRSKKSFVPKNLNKQYTLREFSIHKRQVATFQHNEKVSDCHIIFLHGGAYLFKASGLHWKLAKKIVDHSYCRMTLIDYPLVPEHNFRDTFSMLEASFNFLLSEFPHDDFILMGDSAGAGLALAFSIKMAKEKALKQPLQNILLSPWLDLNLQNPHLSEMKRHDPMLTLELLKYAGTAYADGTDASNYLLSPINGDFSNCPPSIIFFSNKELFYADCIKLKNELSPFKRFIFREYKNMLHDWALFPIPESDKVVEEIGVFINNR